MVKEFYHFAEMGYQDYPEEAAQEYGYTNLLFPNKFFDPVRAAELWRMYLDEYEFAGEVGFDGGMVNEHHNTVICMQESANISAATVLQRIKGKVFIIGNPLPIHDNPVRVAEEIAMLDLISGGRIISGWVRGGGVEQLYANVNPVYNRERFEEAYELIIKAWTTPGPFRWEGKHYHLRVVNPWQLPLQKPYPPIWMASILSPETIAWAARRRIPYMVLGTALDATMACRQLYHDVAAEDGWTPTADHLGYLIHICVQDTDEEAYELGKHHYGLGRGGAAAAAALTQSTGSAGATGRGPHPEWAAPPGYLSKAARNSPVAQQRRSVESSYDAANRTGIVVTGNPETVTTKLKHMIDRTDPSVMIFWDREGRMSHEATMRSIELIGKEVLPALRAHTSAIISGNEVTPWPQP